MKKIITVVFMCSILIWTAKGLANGTAVYQQDWQSPQAVIAALYDSISAEAGEQRDWQRFRALFFEGTRFTMALPPTETGGIVTTDVEKLIEQTEQLYKPIGFFEIETDQHIIKYNQMANIYSSFEIKKSLKDEQPLMRGLNHFQLLFDGKRWWVVSNTSILIDDTFKLAEQF